MTQQIDAAAARAFIEEVWPHGFVANGRMTVWRGSDKKSWHYDKAESAVTKSMMHAAHADMYFGVGLRRNGTRKRGGLDDVVALPGFPADLDAAKPDNQKNYPPTKDQVAEILLGLPVLPSLVWDSGGGLQALWLFHKPWIITPETRPVAIEACREFGRAVRQEFQRAGYEADYGSDLSKVLRMPGTINQKWQHTVCRLPELNGQRYEDWKVILSALGRDIEAISQTTQSRSIAKKQPTQPIESLDEETIKSINGMPEASRLLKGDLTNADPSGGDFRLKMLLEQVGIPRGQIGAAISARRTHISQHPAKASEQSYIDRTLDAEPRSDIGYTPQLRSGTPHSLQMLDAAHVHVQEWGDDEHLTLAHQSLLCELARWCKQGNVATVAVETLGVRLRGMTRQRVSQLLRDLRAAGCINFDPKFSAARGRLRPTTILVVEHHSKHVNPALPVQQGNTSTGLYLSQSQHVNPALPKSSQGVGRKA